MHLVQLNLLLAQLLQLEVVCLEVALQQLAGQLEDLVALGPRLPQLLHPSVVAAHLVAYLALSLRSAHQQRPRTRSAVLQLRALHSVAAHSVPQLQQHLVVQLENVKAQEAHHFKPSLRRNPTLQATRRTLSKASFSNSHIRNSLPKNFV